MTTMTSRQAEVREELSSLGKELKELRTTETDLTRRIKRTLARAEKANIPKTEAADLLGVHRTTLYRAYQ